MAHSALTPSSAPLPPRLPPLLGNQTQMVPGTDTSSLVLAFCESDAAISSQETQKLGVGLNEAIRG